MNSWIGVQQVGVLHLILKGIPNVSLNKSLLLKNQNSLQLPEKPPATRETTFGKVVSVFNIQAHTRQAELEHVHFTLYKAEVDNESCYHKTEGKTHEKAMTVSSQLVLNSGIRLHQSKCLETCSF